jgi:dTDP-4-dehydrorhamnose 3,5-epimerase
MEFMKTGLPDVLMMKPAIHVDARGFFMETWSAAKFAAAGLPLAFVQDNYSGSIRGTLRGLHYQIRNPQGKLVHVVRGRVFDVAVDLRRSSTTFGQWIGEYLDDENRCALWIPPQFAHGFLVVSEYAEVAYKCTDAYAPECERTLRWDDPRMGIRWPLDPGIRPMLSAKDSQGRSLDEAEVFA